MGNIVIYVLYVCKMCMVALTLFLMASHISFGISEVIAPTKSCPTFYIVFSLAQ